MAIDETGLTKGRVGKLNALRKSVGDDLAEEVFAKWLERQAASQAKDKPDPVAVLDDLGAQLEGLAGDPGLEPRTVVGDRAPRRLITVPARKAGLLGRRDPGLPGTVVQSPQDGSVANLT